jgi:uncharacterized protein (DUF433 family)
MGATIHSINLIATNPKVRSGRPYIIGTTLTVADIAIVKMFHEQDADGIAMWFKISLPQVYAALAYYYEHKQEIDEDIRERERYAIEMKEKGIGSRR